MSGRLKLPPFGRALMDQRDLGRHPKLVYVLYAGRWSGRPENAPCLCVGLDYVHGMYDWGRVVSGVPVHVLWRGDGHRIVRLVAEIAAVSPIVNVTMPSFRQYSAEAFLAPTPRARRRHPLWTREAEQDYIARREEFYDAMLADVTRELAHG